MTVRQVYNLPLLPGYGASTKIRSSPSIKSPGGVSLLERMTIAEDLGYYDSYFPTANDDSGNDPSEYILSHSPPASVHLVSSMETPAGGEHDRDQAIEERQERLEEEDGLSGALGLRQEDDVDVKAALSRDTTIGTHLSPEQPGYFAHVPAPALDPSDIATPDPKMNGMARPLANDAPRLRRKSTQFLHHKVAEAVFFSYGVSVFFGFQEGEERMIMEDCESAGVWARGQDEDDWEVEEFHYVVGTPCCEPRLC